MKKSIYIILFCTLLFLNLFAITANAETINNINGVIITEEAITNLKSRGFTNEDLIHMTQTEYDANKDISGKLLNEEVEYIKIIEHRSKNLISNYNPNALYKNTISPIRIEKVSLTKEQYKKELNKSFLKDRIDSSIAASSLSLADSSQNRDNEGYMVLRAQIYKLSTNVYEARATHVWEKIPSYRLVDVLGYALNSAWTTVKDSTYAKQYWTYHNLTTGTHARQKEFTTSNSNRNSLVIAQPGAAVKLDLPTDLINQQKLKTHSSYIYSRIVPINQSSPQAASVIDVFAQYAHQETIFEASIGIDFTGLGSISITPANKFFYLDTHAQYFR